ncbi:hypothetical protein M5D96_008333, partial [Drosophila gunungcola]
FLKTLLLCWAFFLRYDEVPTCVHDVVFEGILTLQSAQVKKGRRRCGWFQMISGNTTDVSPFPTPQYAGVQVHRIAINPRVPLLTPATQDRRRQPACSIIINLKL